MYMPNAKTRRQAPNATYIPLEYRLRLLPNAKKSTQKKRNVYGQRKKLASPNARDTNMLVFLALGDAKVLSFALGDAKVPDARYFAFRWNIGLIPVLSYYGITYSSVLCIAFVVDRGLSHESNIRQKLSNDNYKFRGVTPKCSFFHDVTSVTAPLPGPTFRN